jgi:hypothetical protein
VTSVNTNVDGVAVAEFNVADDHVGDIVLDFQSGCVSNCQGGGISATNSDNGAFSTNSAEASVSSSETTSQSNDAEVASNLELSADSGNNDASFNTGGDSAITTGDANVNANVLNFVNNNIAGDVILGVVNIFGTLIGDIILSQEALDAVCGGSCAGSMAVANSDNAAGSNNTASASSTSDSSVDQSNNAVIENNILVDANTGANSASFNTNGDSSISTGEANVLASVLNVANTNLNGGLYWLVLINRAGQWFGRIIGADEGENFAASEGMEFYIGELGDINVTNSGNGALSDNEASVSSTQNSSISQSNDAHVVNNLNLSANTGGNDSSYNTGGNSSITTGDANIIANVVNFINNNIVGNGKLVVTIINVFGEWIGDFVGPNAQDDDPSPALGGVSQESSTGSSPSSENSQGSSDQGQPLISSQTPSQSLAGAVAYYVQKGLAGNTSATIVLGGESVSSETAASRIIKINLVWVLFALFPIGIVTTIIRRRRAIAKIITFLF